MRINVMWLVVVLVSGVCSAESLDMRAHVCRADLIYDKPITRSEAGMPIGNGRTGTLIGTTPGAIHMQINRVDVFGNDCTTHSFNRNEDYCAGCGFVDIELGGWNDPPFTEADYRQRVNVYDGEMTLQSKGVKIRAVAHPTLDVIALQIDDQRQTPQPIRIDLRKLRYAHKFHSQQNHALTRERSTLIRTKSHLAKSTLATEDDAILLTQHFTEDDYQCSTAVAIAVQGGEAISRFSNPATVTLNAGPAEGPITVLIASAAGFSEPNPVRQRALQQLRQARAMPFDILAKNTAAWWHDFWSRSYIRLSSDDGKAELVERHFTWWLYLMGSASRGTFPMKYNGMLWNTNGDLRMWGGQQWWHNLSMYYRALPAANHVELMQPLFNMYHGMHDSAALAARQQWGSKGIFIGEISFFNGWEPLPDDIASEMRDLYLFRKPWKEASQRFLDYAYTRHPQCTRWNWKGVGRWHKGRWAYDTKANPPTGHVVHLFGSMGQLACQYWVAYQHTGDRAFLEKQAYPMLKGAAEFYRNYPNLKPDENGTLHVHRVSHMESTYGSKDTMGFLAATRGVLTRAIRAAEILDSDPELRTAWKQTLQRLAPLPHSGLPNALLQSKPDEPVFWMNGCRPSLVDRAFPSYYPVKFLNLCALETQTADPEMFERAVNTFDRRFADGIAEDVQVNVLGLEAVAAARLGKAEAARKFIYNGITNPYNNYCDWKGSGPPMVLPNRMTLREGPGTPGAQRLGNAAYGLTEALLQSLPARPGGEPVIRLFPAWPKQWDAAFKLLARGGFLVEARIAKGKIGPVRLTSQRGGTLRVRNPFTTGPLRLAHNKSWDRLDKVDKDKLLTFETKPGDVIVIQP